MKVQRSAAIQLLVDLGFKATIANDLSDTALAGKMVKLRNVVSKGKEPGTEDSKKLFQEIIAAVEAKEEVEVVNDEAEAPAAKAGKKTAKKAPAAKVAAKGAKGPKPEKPETKAAKKAPVKGPKAEKPAKENVPVWLRPTMIGRMMHHLISASKTKPVTKQDIADKLVKEFPDHDADAVLGYVSAYIMTSETTKRGITLSSNDARPKGYWGVVAK